MKTSVREIFGCNVFNDAVMKERLPKSAYKKMRAAIEAGAELDPEVADIVADGKITIMEFMHFARKHNVKVSLEDLPKYTEQARKLGFIK